MATPTQWLSAARPKTLPASLSPVIMGIGAAAGLGFFSPFRSLLALLVALGFQVGVNFSNDYSDGIRGTDSAELRIGPQRLTGSGAAQPERVKYAAFAFYGLAAVCGLILVWLSGAWTLLGLGALGMVAGWEYTGGDKPYGYRPGIAELMVFFFFGWVAVLGTVWVQMSGQTPTLWGTNAAALGVSCPSRPYFPLAVWLGATGVGLLSCALLMVNNLRDIPGDRQVGKNTLAVKLGDRAARKIFALYLLLALALGVMAVPNWWGRLGIILIFTPLFSWQLLVVGRGAKGKALISSLQAVGLCTLAYGVVLAGLWVTFGV